MVDLHWKMMECMRRMNSEMERQLAPMCSQFGLTTLQLNILLTLSVKGPQTISNLARYTCMAEANNSALCKKLEKDGFLQRKRDINDERQVVASLTAKGKDVVRQFSALCGNESKTLFARMTPQQANCITTGFDTLLTVLNNTAEDNAHE